MKKIHEIKMPKIRESFFIETNQFKVKYISQSMAIVIVINRKNTIETKCNNNNSNNNNFRCGTIISLRLFTD